MKTLPDEPSGVGVCLAFLQMASPSIEDVVSDLAGRGVRRIRVLPLLLSAGNHVDGDSQDRINALQMRFPAVELELLPPLFSQPRFKAMLLELVKESL